MLPAHGRPRRPASAEPLRRPRAARTVSGPASRRVPQRGHRRPAAPRRRTGRRAGAAARGAGGPRRPALRAPRRVGPARCGPPTPRSLGCAAEDLALTTCTSEGLALVLGGLRLSRGEEILTSEEEHPGLLGALAAERDLRGVTVRAAPWSELPGAVGPRTRLVAFSHVSWMTGLLAPPRRSPRRGCPCCSTAPRASARSPPTCARCVAPPTPGRARSGCAAPTGPACSTPPRSCASGSPSRAAATPTSPTRRRARRRPARRTPGAWTRSRSAPRPSPARSAAFQVLERAGWARAARARPAARRGTRRAARRVRARSRWSPDRAGRGVVERQTGRGSPATASESGEPALDGHLGTLVTFSSPDPLAERERLAEQGVVLRDIPGRPWLRASVGAWNDEGDLDRLLDALQW